MPSRPVRLGVPVLLCAVLAGSPGGPVLHAQAPAAQAPAAALPEARTIIDRYVAAIGGRDAIKRRSSIKGVGVFEVPSNGMKATMEIYAARPNKRLVKISLPGVGDIMTGFDGTHAWSMDPMTGPRLATGEELAQQTLDSDFDADLDPANKYKSIKTLEKTTFDGRECYKVSLVRKDGVEDFDFYDVKTGLKAGSINKRANPMGTLETTSVLSDYKNFGDLLLPSTMRQSVMGTQMVTTITSMEYNNVEPSVFDLPAQIKALIKQ